MLPAILYVPLLVASYFIFDLFHAETAEIPDKTMQMTEYLNPDLPDARIKGDIGSKYENMAKSWGKIQDYSAVDNIEREESDDNKEEYESQYTMDDIALLDEQQQEKAAAAQIADAKTREQEALAELEKALAEARLKGRNEVLPPTDTDSTATAAQTPAAGQGVLGARVDLSGQNQNLNQAAQGVLGVRTGDDAPVGVYLTIFAAALAILAGMLRTRLGRRK